MTFRREPFHRRRTGTSQRRNHGGRHPASILLVCTSVMIAPWHAAAQNGDSPHGDTKLAVECVACHTTAGWRSIREPLDFDHGRQTRFVLAGRHVNVDCGGCHLKLRFDEPRVSAGDCSTCHLDVHQGALSAECGSCHNTQSFLDAASLDQHARGRFPLTGAHIQISCEACHQDDRGGAFAPLDTDCHACHRADYEAARTIDHAATGLPRQCTQCHNTVAWRGAAFDHSSSGFALEGRHATVGCTGCHQDNGALRWSPAGPMDCVACHRADYEDEHAATGYPTDCGRCHSVDGWSGANFDHGSAVGGFELIGAHQALSCTDCHVPPDHTLRWTSPAGQDDCVACHRTDYDREHPGTGYPTTCQTCHDVNDWAHAVFDHVVSGNGFALVGAHAQAPCTACHGPDDTLLFPQPSSPDDCIACHQAEYDAAHAGSGYPGTCGDCHTTSTFTGATFDHSATSFPLVGAHTQAECTTCHGPNNTLLFPQPSSPDDCIACHQTEYDAAHAGSGYPGTCGDCHTTSTFAGATFDHSTTSFPLVGAHAQAQCTACHGPNNTLLFPKPSSPDDCIACHQADYDQYHLGTGYPTTCLMCHDTAAFTGAVFDHDAQWFPIYTGAHAHKWSTCGDCHPVAADYTAFTCLTCHEHEKTKMDDKHKSMTGYAYDSATCLGCHPAGRK